MTTSEAPAILERVGHYYVAGHTYEVGREKVREYARAVQDYHPAHWDDAAAAALGMDGWGDGRWARMADALSLPAGEIPTGGNVAPPSPPQVATSSWARRAVGTAPWRAR